MGEEQGLYRKSIMLFSLFRHLAGEGRGQGFFSEGAIQAFFIVEINVIKLFEKQNEINPESRCSFFLNNPRCTGG